MFNNHKCYRHFKPAQPVVSHRIDWEYVLIVVLVITAVIFVAVAILSTL